MPRDEKAIYAELVTKLAAMLREVLDFQRTEGQDRGLLDEEEWATKWDLKAAKHRIETRDEARKLLQRVLIEGPR